MEKKIIKIEENQIIEIGGAIINEDVIRCVKLFQEEDNQPLEAFKEYIANSICLMLRMADDNSSFLDEAIRVSTDLSYYRDYVTGLKKPIIITPTNN